MRVTVFSYLNTLHHENMRAWSRGVWHEYPRLLQKAAIRFLIAFLIKALIVKLKLSDLRGLACYPA